MEFLPAIGIALVLAFAEQNIPLHYDYPANHYIHFAEGMAITMAVNHYYGESTAWKVGLGLAVGAEIVGKLQHKKVISGADIATRALGTGAGIWLYRRF